MKEMNMTKRGERRARVERKEAVRTRVGTVDTLAATGEPKMKKNRKRSPQKMELFSMLKTPIAAVRTVKSGKGEQRSSLYVPQVMIRRI